jgi:hypothetical protein
VPVKVKHSTTPRPFIAGSIKSFHEDFGKTALWVISYILAMYLSIGYKLDGFAVQ